MTPSIHGTGYSSSKLFIPEGLPKLLESLSREVLRQQPLNIIQFAAEHFSKLLDARNTADHASAISQDKFLWQVNANKIQDDMDKNLTQYRAALCIQKTYKAYIERKKFNAKKNAVNIIKSKYHQHYSLRSRSASVIQLHYRKHLQQKSGCEQEMQDNSETVIEEASAIKIQAAFRGYQSRKSLKETNDIDQEVHKAYDDDEIEKAAIIIQKNIKGFLVRKKLRRHDTAFF